MDKSFCFFFQKEVLSSWYYTPYNTVAIDANRVLFR
jgi:hypothetical protein